MKIPYFFILTACAAVTNVYAGPPRLPDVLDDSTYNGDAIPSPPAQPAAPNYYNDGNKLERLQSEISELKNKVQEQEEAINRLRSSSGEPQKKPLDLKSPAASKLPELGTAPTPVAKKLTGAEDEKDRYQRGSALLKKGSYAQAISEFQGIVKTYPTGKYADNAQYWIGVALLNKGDKKAAIQAFDRLARNYPQSEKVPEGLFKLGDALLSDKNRAKAKEYFDYVIQNYPGSNGAKLAAKKKAAAKL